MQQQNWDALTQDQQRTLLTTMPVAALATQFNRPAELFKRLEEYLKAIPAETSSESRNHYPPKALILNARRDLSFFEANFELIDNSIDEWRKNGSSNTLRIEMNYDLELLTGEFEDDAGGMAEADVYKVFIPGESTNSDYSQSVIGSFGMGAKKAIFRLSDGAKVVSCTSDEFSVTSAVPERWESESEWRTTDGRSKAIGKGKTKFYFLKLILPPTIEDISELNIRVGQVYAPLLRGDAGNKKIEVVINKVEVKPATGITFSGAAGAEPRTYKYTHTFTNLVNSEQDVQIHVRLTVGLLTGLPGTKTGRGEDWGIDAYGNDRLIEAFLKKQIGFDKKGLGMGNQATKLIRGELHIDGHSIGIPWDTHKREYLPDHPVSLWIAQIVRPRLQDYLKLAGAFSSDTEVRQKELSKPFKGVTVSCDATSGLIAETHRPKWTFKPPTPAATSTFVAAGPSASPITIPKDIQLEGDESDETDLDTTISTTEISLVLSDQDKASLIERFAANDDDQLSAAIVDCLLNGVAYQLEPEQLQSAIAFFEVKDNAELSEVLASEMVRLVLKARANAPCLSPSIIIRLNRLIGFKNAWSSTSATKLYRLKWGNNREL